MEHTTHNEIKYNFVKYFIIFFGILILFFGIKIEITKASSECDGTNTVPCHGGTGHTSREYDSVISATDLGYIYYDSTECSVTIDIILGPSDTATSVNCTNPDYGWYYGIAYIGTGTFLYGAESFFDHPWTWIIAGEPYHPDGINIITPENGTTVSDFNQWTISKYGNTSDDFVIGIHYSTDETIVTDCEDFPSGPTSGYTECINGDPNIFTDYSPFFSGGVESSGFKINKNTPLTLGQTYYAQAVAQYDSAFGAVIMASPIISFTIGVPETGTELQLQTCTTFDIFCHIKNGINFIKNQFVLLGTFLSDLWEPDFLQNFFPLNVLLTLNDLLNTTITGSEHINVNMNLGTLGTVEMVSTETAETWIGTTALNTMKTILGYTLWIALFWFLWETTNKLFIKLTQNSSHE